MSHPLFRYALPAARSPLLLYRPCLRCLYSTGPASSTSTTTSPLLSRLRQDLKEAMRSKAQSRLSVLRALLAEITNASKTATPIATDIQFLSLLRKHVAVSRTAADEFAQAGRDDLRGKEEQQIAVLEEYVGGLEQGMVGQGEIRKLVEQVVEGLRAEGGKLVMGDVLKRCIGPGGALDGRMVEKKSVVEVVKKVMEEKGR